MKMPNAEYGVVKLRIIMHYPLELFLLCPLGKMFFCCILLLLFGLLRGGGHKPLQNQGRMFFATTCFIKRLDDCIELLQACLASSHENFAGFAAKRTNMTHSRTLP